MAQVLWIRIRVLQFPAVASKSFLITIGDRSVTGMVTRDQMCGPWQVPVADVAVTVSSFETYHGQAMGTWGFDFLFQSFFFIYFIVFFKYD